jgi:Mn2+/Fe2+ NRAMP family transporter
MDISSAAEAARALKPLAGNAAGLLFAVGVIGVGFLAVPVMTAGAAYDFCQAFGWKTGLHVKPVQAKPFYVAITLFTAIAIGRALSASLHDLTRRTLLTSSVA